MGQGKGASAKHGRYCSPTMLVYLQVDQKVVPKKNFTYICNEKWTKLSFNYSVENLFLKPKTS